MSSKLGHYLRYLPACLCDAVLIAFRVQPLITTHETGADRDTSLRGRLRGVTALARDHPILVSFIGLALLLRVIFWLYTGRVWEDALVTITAARNVWDGVGLTHHASEPRVHSFTSPLSVLIPLVGEAFHSGLLALRLASLAGAVAAIYFAYRIGTLLAFHWAAHILVLSYLACDQLQIFFGMAGMETQVATAIALAVLYFYLQNKWRALGVACGLATIARPEFIMFLLPPLGLALLLFHIRDLPKVSAPALAIALPWYTFAQLYYGSVIPNTIVAKSLSFRNRFLSAPAEYIWNYVGDSWCDYVPFKEFWIARSFSAPLPDAVLKIILAILLLLAFGGLWTAIIRKSGPLLVAGAAVIGFLVYRNTTVLNSYYMWYLPPFLALAFIIAGHGLSQFAQSFPRLSCCIGPALGFCYAFHLPFSLPLDKKVQREIEVAVRERAGKTLNEMTTNEDTIVLEPLGFVGWAARNKTIFDFPGLGSRVSVAAIKKMPGPTVAALIDALQPTHALVRPDEYDELVREFPDTAVKYTVAAHIFAQPLRLQRTRGLRTMSYEYGVMDNDFRILRRTTDFGQVVRP